jgi:tripartite-type tricarboxylate transporter receptor subunit TctC
MTLPDVLIFNLSKKTFDMRRLLVRSLIVGATLAATFVPGNRVLAQSAASYPDRPVQFVVPYPAGGPIDSLTRAFADRFKNRINGQTLVVNRAGGNLLVATLSVHQAKPDGYSLLVQSAALTTTLLSIPNAGYDAKDFTLVAPMGIFSYYLFVNAATPVNNVEELIAFIRKKGDATNVGILSPGSTPQLLSRRFVESANLKVTEIPYKGTTDRATALVTGDVDYIFSVYAAAAPHVESGKLKMLAVAADERSAMHPKVPTFRELGLQRVTGPSWTGLFARSDTPPDVLAKIQKAAYEVATDPDFHQAIAKGGFDPWTPPNDKMQQFVKDDIAALTADIKALDIKAQ